MKVLNLMIPVGAAALMASTASAALLTSSYEAQLEAWLGQGDLDFTNIFTKQVGDTSLDFHAAADYKGATVTLLKASGGGFIDQIIGGYNSQSWFGIDVWGHQSNPGGFIFNLSAQEAFKLGLWFGSDSYATYNYDNLGPSFGGGYDLYVAGSLSWGWINPYSYGTGDNANVLGGYGPIWSMDIADLEVYTFKAAASEPPTAGVPDAGSTLAMAGLGLLGLVTLRRLLR